MVGGIQRVGRGIRRVARPLRPACESAGLLRRRSFGLDGLDTRLREFVSFRNGIFVEAGANDGINQSNTAYFERYLGWRGLLIEPIPRLAELCRFNRPKSSVVQCALLAADDPRLSLPMRYCNLMSLVEGARGSPEADQAHLDRGKQWLAEGDSVATISVPATTLSALLHRHHLDHIDLLSLDVEGYEAAALQGLDFDEVAPTWILVEENDPQAIADVLNSRYRHVADLSHHDRLYRLAE
jgi:FkbM family methyltransferase